MAEGKSPKESFEEFRKSFFYGSRSDMNFKFLDHLSDYQASKLFSEIFKQIIATLDSGDSEPLKQTLLAGQSVAHANPGTFTYDKGPFTPLTKDPSKAKLTLLTSSGHFAVGNDPEPFGIIGMTQGEAEQRIFEFIREEPELSEIPFSLPAEDIRVRHGGYDIRATLVDPNITFPWQRLSELLQDGIIGALTEYAYSFTGACSQKRLLKKVLPEWIRLMQDNEVDGAILIPV